MKRYNLFLSIVAVVFALISCEDWTEVEAIDYEPNDVNTILQQEDSEYFEKLRAYKESDHPITFTWYGAWSGIGATTKGRLSGLPDSLDIVSLWDNGTYEKGTEKEKDFLYATKVKGLRLVTCVILQGCDKEKFGWSDKDNGESAVRAYARSIVDTIDKYNYHGFDIDFEPSYMGHSEARNIVHNEERVAIFIDELSKFLGPLSGTGRLLVLDGEPQEMPSQSCLAFDYFIVQAYDCTSDNNLDGRLQSTIDNFEGYMTPQEVTRKYVVTENFEKHQATCGPTYYDRNGKVYPYSLLGMANWQPKTGVHCGGIGGYRLGKTWDHHLTPWKLFRESTQALNPAVK